MSSTFHLNIGITLCECISTYNNSPGARIHMQTKTNVGLNPALQYTYSNITITSRSIRFKRRNSPTDLCVVNAVLCLAGDAAKRHTKMHRRGQKAVGGSDRQEYSTQPSKKWRHPEVRNAQMRRPASTNLFGKLTAVGATHTHRVASVTRQ